MVIIMLLHTDTKQNKVSEVLLFFYLSLLYSISVPSSVQFLQLSYITTLSDVAAAATTATIDSESLKYLTRVHGPADAAFATAAASAAAAAVSCRRTSSVRRDDDNDV